MKLIATVLILAAMPALAQSDYYANRFSGQSTQISQSNQAGFNTVNGYYFSSRTKTYYKGKNINRDAMAQSGAQGNLSFTYDRNQYAPINLSVFR